MTRYRTNAERAAEVKRRSVKGAIHVGSAEGRGVIDRMGDVRRLVSEAAARALRVATDTRDRERRSPMATNPPQTVAASAEDIARAFHEAYERLAPSFGYETRRASAVPWEQVPEPNRSLMIAVAAEVRARLMAAA